MLKSYFSCDGARARSAHLRLTRLLAAESQELAARMATRRATVKWPRRVTFQRPAPLRRILPATELDSGRVPLTREGLPSTGAPLQLDSHLLSSVRA